MPKKATTKKGQPAPEASEKKGTLTVLPPVDVSDATSSLTVYGDDPRCLTMPENMPESDYLAYGSKIGHAMEFASWRVGDFVNFGMKQYGYKDYEKIASVTGLAEQYLRACASVASRVPAELRGQHSLEKFRLMLGRRNDAEPIEKLTKRLGNKTISQLRDMGKSGSGGGGQGARTFTASELHQTLLQIANDVSTWDKSKIALMATHEEKNPILAKVRDLLNQMADQIETITAEADAAKDAKKDGQPY